MRPAEILLIIADLLTFPVIAIPRFRAIRWIGSISLITCSLAVFQIFVEGPRWQMVPAYVLAGLFLLVRVAQYFVKPGGFVKHSRIHHLLRGCAIVFCLLALGLSTALPLLFPIFRFPPPGGPYQIGTQTYHWVENRREIFSTDPNTHRELMVQIWYPVKGDTSSARSPYVPDARALSASLTRAFPLPEFIFDHFQYITTNAIPAAPVATDAPDYPVLIFLTGIFGYRQSNTFQIENLVSHGYIVVGLDQPYSAATVVFPDGRHITGWTHPQMDPLTNQSLEPVEPAPTLNGFVLKDGSMPYFAQDVSFTLDQLMALNKADSNGLLTGRLNLKRVGMFGLSLGAMIGSEACHMDARLQACLMMDAAIPADVVQAGLQQPGMWLSRPASDMRQEHWKEKDVIQTLNTMQATFNKEPVGEGYYVSISGMFHVNFSDVPYFTPLGPQLGLTGPINAQRGLDIVNAYTLAFFDQYVKGHPAALLAGPSKLYPEVAFSSRGAGHTPLP